MIRPEGVTTVADHFRIVHFAALFADGFESGDTSDWSP